MNRIGWRPETSSMWMLDELAHAGDEHLDEADVAAYEHKAGFGPTYGADVCKRR